MAYQKKVTKGVFDAVKILIAGGAKVGEVCKYMKISDTTFYIIRDSETYEEYQQYVADKIAKQNAARAARRDAEKKQAAQEAAEKVGAVKAADLIEKQPETPVVQPQIIEHRQSVTLMANHYLMEEVKKQTELLTVISNKLLYIVEQLS